MDVTSRQELLLSCFFGSEDSIRTIEHSEELLEASRKEKEKLTELRTVFNAGLAPGESILLKAPFTAPGGDNEWMWVEVTRWSGNRIQGILANDPEAAEQFHAGQIVDVHQEDIFDFIHQFPDHHTEGNTTGEIIQKLDQSPSPTPSLDCSTH
ncbi:MAG: DUF2314 domain-containing protein [Candidatus Acidiferrum sp.]